jgi:hypothetical protein
VGWRFKIPSSSRQAYDKAPKRTGEGKMESKKYYIQDLTNGLYWVGGGWTNVTKFAFSFSDPGHAQRVSLVLKKPTKVVGEKK